MRGAVAVLLFAACRSKSASSIDASIAADTSVTSSVVIDAAAIDAKAYDPLREVRDQLDRWNDAHVKHAAKILESLYAQTVRFYGQPLSGTECAKRKAAAFAKSPDYTQSIHDVRVHPNKGAFEVTFIKHTSEKGKDADFIATLTFAVTAPDYEL